VYVRYCSVFVSARPGRYIYQDSLETDENLQPKEPVFGKEADAKPEIEEECLWEINPLVTSVDKLNFDTTTNIRGE